MEMISASRPPKIKVTGKKKISLVLSGGGTKAGAFHLGVALALQEHGFTFRGGKKGSAAARVTDNPLEISSYIGSSAGSIISCYLAAGYTLEAIIDSFLTKKSDISPGTPPHEMPKLTYQKMFRIRPEIAKEQLSQLFQLKDFATQLFTGDWEKLFLFNLIKFSGIFSISGLEEFLRKEVLPTNSFHDLAAELFCVSAHLNSSRKAVFGSLKLPAPPHDPTCTYFTDVSVSDACAASAALPFIYAPHHITFPDGSETAFIDGETRETLSSHIAVDSGADLVIASYTHQPYHFTKELGSLVSQGLPAILIQSLYLIIEQKISHHRHTKKVHRQAIQTIDRICREENLSHSTRAKVMDALKAELHFNENVDIIYIHPKSTDTRMFIREHFTLSPNKMSDIVRSGFRATIDTLRKYEFIDRPKLKPASKVPAGDR